MQYVPIFSVTKADAHFAIISKTIQILACPISIELPLFVCRNIFLVETSQESKDHIANLTTPILSA
jgi:hypothetical protein